VDGSTILRRVSRSTLEEHDGNADRVIALDPYDEPLYSAQASLQRRLGRTDSGDRTMRLLQQRMQELDSDPARPLRDPGSQRPKTPSP